MTEAWSKAQWQLVLEAFHRDVEFHDDRAFQGATRGRSAMGRYVESFMGAWAGYSIEFGEPVDAGHGVFYVPWEERAQGRGSGVHVDQTGATVYWVRDGKIAKMHSFHEQVSARRAAGLPLE